MTFLNTNRNLVDEFVNGNEPYVSGDLFEALLQEMGGCNSQHAAEELTSVLYAMLEDEFDPHTPALMDEDGYPDRCPHCNETLGHYDDYGQDFLYCPKECAGYGYDPEDGTTSVRLVA